MDISMKQIHRHREKTGEGLGVWDYQMQTMICTMDGHQVATV